MLQRHPMTVEGAQALQDELRYLKTVERPRIIAAISEARAHGDLKENSEYHAAREQQSFTEGRITEIEAKLAYAQVIDVTKLPNSGKVIFGCTVHLVNLNNEDNTTYQIVCADEADLKQNKISVTSPLARAMIGKHVGDVIEVDTPTGVISYEISEVEYI